MHLGLIENVKQDDFVAAMAQMVQAVQHRLGIGQQIAENHHQAFAADHRRQLVQRRRPRPFRRPASDC